MPNNVKARTVKFSNIENDVYFELERFVHYLAGKNANQDNVMMEYDEIVGELLLEMAKGIKAYPGLNIDQLKAVIRRMMDNRISELRYRFYSTHRSAEKDVISLNLEVTIQSEKTLSNHTPHNDSNGNTAPIEEMIEDIGANPSAIYESAERVRLTRANLSPVASRVFDAVIYGNNMLVTILLLSSKRASFVFKSRNVSMKPWHIADALHLKEEEVKDALKEIKFVYAEVCNA